MLSYYAGCLLRNQFAINRSQFLVMSKEVVMQGSFLAFGEAAAIMESAAKTIRQGHMHTVIKQA